MPEEELKLLVIHPSQQYCEEIIEAFHDYDPDLELIPFTDLRKAASAVEEEDPAAVVVGVDTPNDPSLAVIETISNAHEKVGIIVVSREPSRELLVSCMRAGSDEFIEFPINPEELATAMDNLFRRRGIGHPGEGQVISVFSPSGGVGVTTVACHLATGIAAALGREGAVCLVDLNMQFGSVALALDILEFSHTVADAAHEHERLDENLLRTFMSKHPSGVHVLPAPVSLEDAESIDPWHLRTVVQVCRKAYQFCLLDLPHVIDERSVVGLDEADQIMLLCEMTLPSIRRIIHTLEVFDQLGYKREKVKLIVTRYYDSHHISLEEIAKHVDHPIHWLVPYESEPVINSLNAGQTLDEVAPDSEVTHSLMALAQTIAGLQPKVQARKKAGLFGWFK